MATKSLTDSARTVMSGKKTGPVTPENLNENENQESLKPKSKTSEAPQTLGTPTKLPEQPHKVGDGSNSGAAAAAPVSKDHSAPTKSAKPPQPKLSLGAGANLTEDDEELAEEETLDEDEDLLPEEITDFIDSLVAEGLSEDEIMEELDKVLSEAEEVEEETETVDEDTEEEVTEEEETPSVDMSEHVEALFSGEELSEEFKTKAVTIFEAAVNTKLQEEVARIEAIFEQRLADAIAEISTDLSEDVENYLDYIAEQWLQDNEVAIESGLRTELTEDLMSGLRQLFAENYIDIPEDKVNVVEELGAKVEELEAKLNEEIQRGADLKRSLNESVKDNILLAGTEGLTATQAEKIKNLAETVSFVSEDDFTTKIATLRESYFPATKIKQLASLDANEEGSAGMISENINTSPRMEKYLKALGKK